MSLTAVPEPPSKPPRYGTPKRRPRSRVTSGRQLHVRAPLDNVWSRRFRDLVDEISAMVSNGPLNAAQDQLVRRAAGLSVQCEIIEVRIASGEEIEMNRYSAMADRLGRCFQRLGIASRFGKNLLSRPPKTPQLADYLASKKDEAP